MKDRSTGTTARLGELLRFAGPILLLAALGCAASILGSDPATGLDVVVRRGPLYPLEQPGVENTAPVEGALVRIRPVGETGNARGTTDAEGRVGFAVPAGRYAASVLECPGTFALPRSDTTEVTAGARTSVTLVCDTGIR